ncbi:MAG: hypothetical protein WBP12_03285 [Candidatus Saccharimonas sp.]
MEDHSATTQFVSLRVEGDMGHGSRPQDIKRHAILTALDVFDSIATILVDSRLLLTQLSTEGKNSPNQFPGACTLNFTYTTSNDETQQALEQFLASLERTIRIE